MFLCTKWKIAQKISVFLNDKCLFSPKCFFSKDECFVVKSRFQKIVSVSRLWHRFHCINSSFIQSMCWKKNILPKTLYYIMYYIILYYILWYIILYSIFCSVRSHQSDITCLISPVWYHLLFWHCVCGFDFVPTMRSQMFYYWLFFINRCSECF